MARSPYLRLIPDYYRRVWGGQRLQAGPDPCGEAWVVHEGNRVADGPWAGRTLAEVATEAGGALLGARAVRQTGDRFPLLIKLLDTVEWLSLQVHPDDDQARALEGPGHFGKTEAWHVIEADPTAEVIVGPRPGTTAAALAAGIRAGTLLERVDRTTVAAGDTIFIPAGTIHALGPGLLIYEVQQTSDLTYRVFDWNRPASEGRQLHLEQSIAVSRPDAVGHIRRGEPLESDAARQLIECPYFTLEIIGAARQPVCRRPAGESFHALTVIEGSAHLAGPDWDVPLGRFETVVVPAEQSAYAIRPGPAGCRVLKAALV